MTQSKHTKRALLASVLSVVVCCALLVGSTFAWFTDSVTSGKNQIVAGNLDVELEYATVGEGGQLGNWTPVDSATDLFDADARWEPGHAQVVYLRIRNAGTLALKYQFGMRVESEAMATNVNGDAFLLSQHLQYGVVENQTTAFASRDAAIEALTESKPLAAYSRKGALEAGAAPEYLALVVYMPTTVGNEANYRGDVIPTIDLGLQLFATQDTVEEDSFDDQYDANADGSLTFTSGTENVINQDITVLRAGGIGVRASGEGTKVTIEGGTIDGGSGGGNVGVWAQPGATVNITGGTFTVGADQNGEGNSVIYSTGGDIQISGGFFYTDTPYNGKYYVLNLQNGSGGSITVTGGTFVNFDPRTGDDVDPGSFVADGYEVVTQQRPNGDIWYTVVKAAAGTVDELKSAIDAAANGDTVGLTSDIQADKQMVELAEDKHVTLDLNGKTMTYTEAEDPLYPGQNKAIVLSSGELTLKNGTIAMPTGGTNRGIYLKADTKLTMENMTVTSDFIGIFSAGSNTEILVKNSTITTGTYCAIYHNGNNAPTHITIEDSVLTSEKVDGIYVSNIAGRDRQTLIINNSTISGTTAVEAKHSDVTITDSTLIATTVPTGSGENGNGSCTTGYAFALTSNSAADLATGNVTISNSNLCSLTAEQEGYCFIYQMADGFTASINGEVVTEYNNYASQQP